MKSFISLILLASGITYSVGEPFINLQFEEANTNSPGMTWFPPENFPWPSGQGSMEELVPGWTLTSGEFSVEGIPFNAGFFGEGTVHLISREAYEAPDGIWRNHFQDQFEGDYALAFHLREDRSFILSQQGDVPEDAFLLRYDAVYFSPSFDVEARIDGMVIPNGGDISAFAGQNANLEFEFSRGPLSSLEPNFVGFNGVVFAIPEPGTISLLGLGGLALGWGWFKRRLT